MNFCWSISSAELWWREVTICWKMSIFPLFLEKRPLQENFQNSVPTGLIAIPTDVFCSNFVKFGRLEICKVVRAFTWQKKQNFAWLSSSHYCADRAQNLPGPAPDNVLTVFQILSKLVHFRWSYSRWCELWQVELTFILNCWYQQFELLLSTIQNKC